MHQLTRTLLLSILLIASAASSSATLRLKDGTVVQGEIKSFRSGTYTVDSPSLGELRIDQSRIQSINYGDAGTPPDVSDNTQAQLRQLQIGLASDATIMSMIEGLQRDPQLQAILADPEIMRAVRSGDLQTLMASEKFMALLNNRNIKAITGQVNGQNR